MERWKKTNRQIDRWINGQKDRQTNRQMEKLTDRRIDRQTGGQTDGCMYVSFLKRR